jgi:hypothetical protein
MGNSAGSKHNIACMMQKTRIVCALLAERGLARAEAGRDYSLTWTCSPKRL